MTCLAALQCYHRNRHSIPAFRTKWGKNIKGKSAGYWDKTSSRFNGGEGGIRTHVTVAGKPHFECGAFDHSATSPHAFWHLVSPVDLAACAK
jgi:hypothetical protein